MCIIDFDISVMKKDRKKRTSGKNYRVAGTGDYTNPIIQNLLTKFFAIVSNLTKIFMNAKNLTKIL